MKRHVLISCEHAGNVIPEKYADLFSNAEEALNSHRGIDFGAKELADYLATELKAEYHYTEISRLLVEANRSIKSKSLFSAFSGALPVQEKELIIKTIYHSYRNEVEKAISKHVKEGKQVVHISVHTFTPVLNGAVRNADIGLLYDPRRTEEKAFCGSLKNELKHFNPDWHVRFNYPYKGTADGFTTYLRKHFENEKYIGVEFEINQKYPLLYPEEFGKIKEAFAVALGKLTK